MVRVCYQFLLTDVDVMPGDGHQPNNSGLYTHYNDSLLTVGWVYPQYKELIDPDTCEENPVIQSQLLIANLGPSKFALTLDSDWITLR